MQIMAEKSLQREIERMLQSDINNVPVNGIPRINPSEADNLSVSSAPESVNAMSAADVKAWIKEELEFQGKRRDKRYPNQQ